MLKIIEQNINNWRQKKRAKNRKKRKNKQIKRKKKTYKTKMPLFCRLKTTKNLQKKKFLCLYQMLSKNIFERKAA